MSSSARAYSKSSNISRCVLRHAMAIENPSFGCSSYVRAKAAKSSIPSGVRGVESGTRATPPQPSSAMRPNGGALDTGGVGRRQYQRAACFQGLRDTQYGDGEKHHPLHDSPCARFARRSANTTNPIMSIRMTTDDATRLSDRPPSFRGLVSVSPSVAPRGRVST